MKTIFQFTILAFLTIAAAASARAAEITGRWLSEFESPIGHLKYIYDLKADGGQLAGKAIRESDGQKTETEIKEGKVATNELSFVEPLQFNDQEVRIEYKGTITGDEIKFVRKVGDFATMDIVAKRETASVADVSGAWHAEFDTQIGPQKYTFTFKQDGDKLAGKAEAEIAGEKYATAITEGTLAGDAIRFVEPLKFQEMDLHIEYKGKISGDEMKLTRQVGDVATEELVARRVKTSGSNRDAATTPTSQPLTLKVIKVDSEETAGENGRGTNAVDGRADTIWHTEWQDSSPEHPHEIIIELSAPAKIKGFTYLPRQDTEVNGTIKGYEFFVSEDGKDFGEPVSKGQLAEDQQKKTVTFEPKQGRFIKLRALSEINGEAWTSAAEIGVIAE